MDLVVPRRLVAACRRTPTGRAWLEALPAAVRDLGRRWGLAVGPPFDGPTGSWVAPVTRRDGGPAVLKIALPHMEADHEIAGLRFWAGTPTVRLLEADDERGAMLLERCEPGTPLRALPERDQDPVVADLLRRLWRRPARPHPFRPLSAMLAHWAAEARTQAGRSPDRGLVEEGLRLFAALPRTAPTEALLATDLHAGNVLRARRAPWLVIDPKPFVGDPAYDATQHLLNCQGRLLRDPAGTVRRVAGLLDLDEDRVRRWTFARAAAGPQVDWLDGRGLARALAD